MYISDAIKSTTQNEPYITREKWRRELGPHSVKIHATNGPDLCIIISDGLKNPCRWWQPAAGDLTADDWITTH